MYNKIFLALLILLFGNLSNNSIAQTSIRFSRIFEDTSNVILNTYLGNVIYDKGTNNIFTTMSSFNNYYGLDKRPKKYTQIIQTDEFGNIINQFKDSFDWKFEYEYNRMIITDSFIYAAGYIYDTNYFEYGWQVKSMLIKLDKNLNKIWRIELPNIDRKLCTPGNLIELDDKNLLYSYNAYGNEISEDFPETKVKMILCKVSPNGEILWDSSYEDDIDFYGVLFNTTTNNSVLVAGQTNTSFSRTGVFIMEMDSVGDLLRKNLYNTEYYWSNIRTCQSKLNSNHYYAVGTILETTSDDSKGYVFKFNNYGDVLWKKILGSDNGFINLSQGLAVSDGSIVGIGNSNFDNISTYKSSGWINKIDSAGNVLWSRKIPQTSTPNTCNEYLHSVVELPDSSFVLVGSTGDLNSAGFQEQYGWMVRTDKYGCIEEGCHLLSTNTLDNDIFNLQILPNPTIDGKFRIEFGTWKNNQTCIVEILNTSGMILQSIEIPKGIIIKEVDISNLSKGLYFVKLKSNYLNHTYKIVKY